MRKGVQEADEAFLARSMDSDITEQAVAAMLADEALQLRRAAGFQGYSAFLQKPVVRARPNKQFLAATVRSVESANRMAQVSDMWHLRKKELSEEEGSDGRGRNSAGSERRGEARNEHKLPNPGGDRSRMQSKLERQAHTKAEERKTELLKSRGQELSESGHHRHSPTGERFMHSSSKVLNIDGECARNSLSDRCARERRSQDRPPSQEWSDSEGSSPGRAEPVGPQLEDSGEAIQEQELEEFLHSRRKRGRGSVGSRMDESGPFATATGGEELHDVATLPKAPVVLGPRLPPELEKQRKRKRKMESERSSDEGSGMVPLRKKRKHRTEEDRRARKEERRKRRLEKER